MPHNTDSDPTVFYLPDLGEGLEEAELIEWCVRVGQSVKENDTLAKMETAKAVVEIPSPRDGTIANLHGKPGQAIKVGSPLVTYKAAGRTKSDAPTDPAPANDATVSEKPRDAGSVVGDLGDASDEVKVLAAPAVRRRAMELGVDLDQIEGTGVGGRITTHDVEAASHTSPTPALPASAGDVSDIKSPPRAQPSPAEAGNAVPSGNGATRIPFRGVRKAIAEHLHHSITHAVHFTVMDEADVTALDELRRKLVAASNEKISLLPFVASAVCRVLSGKHGQQFVRLNSTVDDKSQEIVQHRAVHLGVATDTDAGLMVPVIRDADRLGVLELSRQIAKLAKAARDRSLAVDQLSGSTFTISNFGSIGGRFGTPIINYPEAGILAVGRSREGVVVREGMLGVGKLLPLSLAADHRVIDGATASTALARIIELLQKPEELLPPGR